MNRTLADIWAELASATDTHDGIRRLRLDPDRFKIYAGWSMPIQQPALVLEVATSSLPADVEFPQSVGFAFSTIPLVPGRDGIVRIAIEAQDDRFNDIFPVLIQDIYEHIISARDETQLVHLMVSRLYHWQVFLKRHRHVHLSEAEQTGLWGELWFLHSRLIQLIGIGAAIASWQGPDRRNQDFEFSGTAVEVKTTSANPHEILHVSNVRQLEPEGLNALYLYHIAVVIHRESGISLPDLIADIRGGIQEDPKTLEKFNERLFRSGYLDSEASWYDKTGYHVLSQNAYRVDDGFPRISMDTIPDGVGDVKFSLTLSSCADFCITPDPFISEELDNE